VTTPAAAQAPSLARRFAGLLYEGVLLFGVVMLVGLIYSPLTGQRHALAGSPGLRATLFLVLGLYFTYFWSRHGQTLAMKTWHLRLLGPDGHPPAPLRAGARYLLAWLWFLPALAGVGLWGQHVGLAAITAVVIGGMLAYAALVFLRSDRQFLHDALCGTRLVEARPSPSSTPSATPRTQ
jgi:uncharacterized RDD family membrane protein YckC